MYGSVEIVGSSLNPSFWQAHVVAAFEQSLQSMTKRVHSLTAASEQKVAVEISVQASHFRVAGEWAGRVEVQNRRAAADEHRVWSEFRRGFVLAVALPA